MQKNSAISFATELSKLKFDLPNIGNLEDIPILEEDYPTTFAKFLCGQYYDTIDISNCASKIFTNEDFDIKKHFTIALSLEDMKKFLSKHGLNMPTYIVWKERPKWWALVVIFWQDEKWRALYQDPSGGENMPKEIQNLILAIRSDVVIYADKTKKNDVPPGLSGAITMRNLRSIHRNPKVNFSSMSRLFPQNLRDEKINRLIFLVRMICGNSEFKTALRSIGDAIPKDFVENIEKYKEKLATKISLAEYEKHRNQYLNKDQLEKMRKITQSGKFEKEFSNFQKILTMLKYSEASTEVLPVIRSFLNLDDGKADSVEEIQNNPPAVQIEIPKPDVKMKIDELVGKLVLGIGPNNSKILTPEEYKTNPRILKLESGVSSFWQHFENYRKQKIGFFKDWGMKNKGKLILNEQNIYETAAIVAAGSYYGRKKFFSNSSIIALLLWLERDKNQLFQMQNSEERADLIALLAIIRVLQGRKVDVITSIKSSHLTPEIFACFGVSVRRIEETRSYLNDVVYGPLEKFQFGYLKDKISGNQRPFDFAILDDVDLYSDNREAELSENFQGMKNLRYIYVNIWISFQKVENDYLQQFHAKIKGKIQELATEAAIPAKAVTEYKNFLEDLLKKEKEVLVQKILEYKPEDVSIIPEHLKNFVKNKLRTWADSAVNAKYHLHENVHYQIFEEKVVPIDFKRTGNLLKDTTFLHGQQQFLELKHNLKLNLESIRSSFVSNIGYIKKYKNIEGAVEVLGSNEEEKFLAGVFNMDFARIPTFGQKNITEVPGIVSEDIAWSKNLTLETLNILKATRSVLIVCESHKHLSSLKQNFEILRQLNVHTIQNILVYAEESEEPVKQNTIILSTKYDVNVKIVPELEKVGGIHVIIGFLPSSKRIERRCFTSALRHSTVGSIQMVLKKSEISTPENDFAKIGAERDQTETKHLQAVNNKLNEMQIAEELFDKLTEYYKIVRRGLPTDPRKVHILKDLRESWAIWLDLDVKNGDANERFNRFLENVSLPLADKLEIEEYAFKNPFNHICAAEDEIDQNFLKRAQNGLKDILEKAKSNKDISLIYGAASKIFQLEMKSGGILRSKVEESLNGLFGSVSYNNYGYKKDAGNAISTAARAVSIELDFLNNYFVKDNQIKKDFELIINSIDGGNSLVKQAQANLESVMTFSYALSRLGALLQGLKRSKAKLAINTKISNYFSQELTNVGLKDIYSVTHVGNLSKEDSEKSRELIQLGNELSKLALFFPSLNNSAFTLISEGFCDIFAAVLKYENEPVLRSQILSEEKNIGNVLVDIFDKISKIHQGSLENFKKQPCIQEASQIKQIYSGHVSAAVDGLFKKMKEERAAKSLETDNSCLQFIASGSGIRYTELSLQGIFNSFTSWMKKFVGAFLKNKFTSNQVLQNRIKMSNLEKLGIMKYVESYIFQSSGALKLATALTKKFQGLLGNFSSQMLLLGEKFSENINELESFEAELTANLVKNLSEADKAKHEDAEVLEILQTIVNNSSAQISELVKAVIVNPLLIAAKEAAEGKFEENIKNKTFNDESAAKDAQDFENFKLYFTSIALELHPEKNPGNKRISEDFDYLMMYFGKVQQLVQ